MKNTIVAGFIIAMLLMVGCTKAPTEPQEIKLGAILILSGAGSVMGTVFSEWSQYSN